MKIKVILTSLSIASLLVSCQELDNEYKFPNNTDLESVSTHASSNNVRIEDIRSLHKDNSNGTRSSVDIDCICDEANDTLLYVYNKPEGGWIVYSSDMRVPPIIAESESGSFADLLKNETAKYWVETLASDLKMIKVLDDGELNFTASEINSNKSFWSSDALDCVSSSDKINGGTETSTNGNKDLPPIILEPKGHYEFSGCSYFTETYDSISRLTTTNWDQGYPYNKFCPFRTDFPNLRAPAGCAPVAVAQMLYFLHNKYGIPRTAPSKAYCYGNIDTDYNWAQTDYTEEIWDEMRYNAGAAAPLIADLGRRMNTIYGNGSSSTKENVLASKELASYGVNATFTDYNVDLVKQNLLNGLPVLIEAYSIDPDQSSKNVGHAFIVDRYKRMRIRREAHYSWVYDESSVIGFTQCVPDSIVVSYLAPEINMIGMNWGWESYYNIDSEWYALTGDWIKCYGYNGDNYNFNIKRKMIYVNSINLNQM